MGSAKVWNTKPLPMEKPTKTPLLSSIIHFFNKKKDKAKCEKEIEKQKHVETNSKQIDAVANIIKGIDKLALKHAEEKQKEQKKKEEATRRDSTEDEFSNFNFKIVEDDRRRHSSEDSGFSDLKEEFSKEDQEVIDSFHNLKIEESEKEKDGEKRDGDSEKKEEDAEKRKKLQEVVISRAPIRSKVSDYNVDPYAARQVNHQINQQALCGGQVYVSTPDNFVEVDIALQKLSQTSVNHTELWQDVLEVIDEDSTTKQQNDFLNDILKEKPEDLLKDFKDFVENETSNLCINVVPNITPTPNPIEEFTESQNLPIFEDTIDLTNPLSSFENQGFPKMDSIFPTPPRSETVPSPMSESHASFYPPNWTENSLSPERSSPIYISDYEKYQEISQYNELSPISEKDDKVEKRERTNSLSSMTMKNFKDIQKDIANEFSKKDCCQINRKSCKELFDDSVSKLKAIERKSLCFKVSKMDLKTAYGVLHHIILSISSGSEQEELQYALFVLICQRLLAQSPALFYGDFANLAQATLWLKVEHAFTGMELALTRGCRNTVGLSILKAAVLRCPQRPLLTRFVVHYIYAALKLQAGATGTDCVFHEVDALGDNLIIACARAGDAYALVLSEITRVDVRGDLPPLFRVHHANADGHTALHVACIQHSASSPRLHTQHVLLEHARADLWKGDVKGGDTALHLAVNSANCDLRVIMMLFKQIDRKQWKKLAHCQNMSSVTPLEYARSATKSTTRQNYPTEVLDFLKKCR